MTPLWDVYGDMLQVDAPFIRNAISRFRSAKNALNHLRKLGKPPTSHSAILSISPSTKAALEVVGALAGIARGLEGDSASQLASFYLRREWESANIALWIQFLLRKFVLADDYPSSPEALDALEHTLTLIPPMLTCPKEGIEGIDSSNFYAGLTKLSPTLHPIFVHVWCKVLERQHHTWAKWSALLKYFAETDLTIRLSDSPMKRMYPSDSNPAAMGYGFFRHLHCLIPNIDKMTISELLDVRSLVEAVTFCHRGPESEMFQKSPAVAPSIVFAVSTLLLRLVTKRKTLLNATADSVECKVLHSIAVGSAVLIANILKWGTTWSEEAVKAGVLKAVVKAYPCLFERDRQPDMPPEGCLDVWLGRILEAISRALFYAPMLHLFTRAERKISAAEGEGLSETLKAKSEPLYYHWVMAGDRARMIRMIRSMLRARNPRLRCQKIDWKAQHQVNCPIAAEVLSEPAVPAFTEYDFRVMEVFVTAYLQMYGQVITSMINSFLEDLQSREGVNLTSLDVRHIIKGTKSPIVLCDFATPSLSEPKSCVTIFDPLMMEGDERLYRRGAAAWVSGLMEDWRKEVNDGSVVLTVALFAGAPGKDEVVGQWYSFQPLSAWNPVFGGEENVLD
ncbi:hypothetical protein PQX77_011607 [Marasmius sp. AFHP31]|nr:hypothetical protein PQX77_011607 [Marasmius sp. AFHP31]